MGTQGVTAFLTVFVFVQSTALQGQSPAPQDLPHAFPREGAIQVLDNHWGTAWDAVWIPNKTTAMHRHAYDYVGVELVDSTFNVTLPGGQPRTSSLRKGSSYFLPKGTTHSEEGLSSNPPRHAVLIDLKDAPPSSFGNTSKYPTAFPAEVARKVVENQRIVMWDVTWTPESPESLYFYDRNTFIVFIDAGDLTLTTPDGPPQVLSLSPGKVLFWPAGTARGGQAADGPVHAIVVQLK